MNRFPIWIAAAAVLSMMPASAGWCDEGPDSGFGAWRVSAGGNIGFGLKTKLGFKAPGRVYSGPTSPALGTPADIAARLASGGSVDFLDGTYIDPNGDMAAPYTKNWRFPVSSLDRTTGAVTLHSAQTVDGVDGRGSDDDAAFGASVELSRTLYAHESGFGVDFAVGFSWMRCNNCYKASSSGMHAGRSTYVYIPSPGNVNGMVLTSPFLAPNGEFYGAGSASGMGPVLDWSDLGPDTISQTLDESHYRLSASGDYEEWAFSFMFKPWWEVTDWCRLTGTIGLGAARSEFDCTVSGIFGSSGTYSSHDKFHEWKCYGIGGMGTVFRLWRVDLSFDILARFCNDDMSIRSESLSGKIEKPDVILSCALGFEF